MKQDNIVYRYEAPPKINAKILTSNEKKKKLLWVFSFLVYFYDINHNIEILKSFGVNMDTTFENKRNGKHTYFMVFLVSRKVKIADRGI